MGAVDRGCGVWGVCVGWEVGKCGGGGGGGGPEESRGGTCGEETLVDMFFMPDADADRILRTDRQDSTKDYHITDWAHPHDVRPLLPILPSCLSLLFVNSKHRSKPGPGI